MRAFLGWRIDCLEGEACICIELCGERWEGAQAHHSAADGDLVDGENAVACIGDDEFLAFEESCVNSAEVMAFRRDGKDGLY